MRLGELKKQIGDHPGSVFAWSNLLDSWIAQQKGSLKDALDHKFEKKRNVETYMKIEPATGRLVHDRED
jgi:hypothetical protein